MTRFSFTLSGYLDVADPALAPLATGPATSFDGPGEVSSGLLEPEVALQVLLSSALRKGLAPELGAHEVHVQSGAVRVAPEGQLSTWDLE